MIITEQRACQPSMSLNIPDDAIETVQLTGLKLRWISQFFFKEMSADMVLHLRNHEVGAEIEELFDLDELKRPVSQLLKIIQREHDIDSFVLDLATEYSLLFSGVSGEQSAFPYQSAYQEESNSCFQSCEVDCRKFYELHGQGLSHHVNEPADHLAIQLEFVSYLCRKISQETQSEFHVQIGLLQSLITFQNEHLLSWVPEFTHRCRRLDTIGVYKLLARITLVLLSRNQEIASRLGRL